MINLNNRIRDAIFTKEKINIIVNLIHRYNDVNDDTALKEAESVCRHLISVYPCFSAAKMLSVVLLKANKPEELKFCLDIMENTIDRNNEKQISIYEKLKFLIELREESLKNILDNL